MATPPHQPDIDPLHDEELTRLRRMTASEKVAVMHALWRQAWALKEAEIRARHPAWSTEQVTDAVRESFRGERP